MPQHTTNGQVAHTDDGGRRRRLHSPGRVARREEQPQTCGECGGHRWHEWAVWCVVADAIAWEGSNRLVPQRPLCRRPAAALQPFPKAPALRIIRAQGLCGRQGAKLADQLIHQSRAQRGAPHTRAVRSQLSLSRTARGRPIQDTFLVC